MARHNIDISFMEHLDTLQVAQMITELYTLNLEKVRFPNDYPDERIPGHYVQTNPRFKVPESLVKKVYKTLTAKIKPVSLLPEMSGAVKKHRKKKPKVSGDRSTAAVLCDMKEFQRFCEYILMYHAWCHYGHDLPIEDRLDDEMIDKGSRSLLRYFNFIVYRGDGTCDTNTCKTHTLSRNGWNNRTWGSLMNTSCHLGERLLKTHAKGVSKTAQKRGEGTFLFQTAHRAVERMVVTRAFEEMEETELRNSPPHPAVKTRKIHFFEFKAEANATVTAVTSEGKRGSPNKHSGFLPSFLIPALMEVEQEANEFHVWNEITLRDAENRVRAHPNYSQRGPWYDWVRCKFQDQNKDGTITEAFYPARALCFYRVDGVGELKCLVHSGGGKKTRSVESKTLIDSNLCVHYRMEFRPDNKPFLHGISVDAIDRTILACPSYDTLIPKDLVTTLVDDIPTVMVVLPRTDWAQAYIDFTRALLKENKEDTGKKRVTTRKFAKLTKVNLGVDLLMSS